MYASSIRVETMIDQLYAHPAAGAVVSCIELLSKVILRLMIETFAYTRIDTT